ncbi:hypothetical protein EYF80_047679 [Liparis tanakae]|uniref:Uncharacterized protein n=1 Tax=Liparis tanakae TaxID=230148 RepID=A0A4Z2FLK6_9TELE|nr:hypothetical protein EYF80_047679 [Liparis tanakae]
MSYLYECDYRLDRARGGTKPRSARRRRSTCGFTSPFNPRMNNKDGVKKDLQMHSYYTTIITIIIIIITATNVIAVGLGG